MLDEYFDYEIRCKFTALISEDDDYRADYSQFNVVDGEEGDYGVIRYFHGDELVAIKNVYGGDSEEVEFTSFGKTLFNAKLINALTDATKVT